MDRTSSRAVCVGLALVFVLAACSGNKPVSVNEPTSQGSTTEPSSSGGPTFSNPSGKPVAADPASGATSKGSAKTSPKPFVGGTKQKTSSGITYTAANIFKADEDRVGITDSQLTLCMHAPASLAAAFQDSTDDWTVYWKLLNDSGGIYGRKVNIVIKDDQYNIANGGVAAAQQCYDNNPRPFLMTAGVGFDTVPAVRDWAETHSMLYLASFATEKKLFDLTHSFEGPPSVEQFGAVAGRFVGAKYPHKVGVIWRNSPNWQGGRDRFRQEVAKKGGSVEVDLPVQQNKGDYSNEIKAMKDAKLQTVLAWINVLEFDQLEAQAASQNFYPRWVLAGFNLVTDTVGQDISGEHGPPAIGIWVTPEYHDGDMSAASYYPEVKAMRDAYVKYDPNHKIVDTDWQAWLAFKQITKMFVDCGRDCTRNKLAGMWLSGYKTQLAPLCVTDFARGRGKIGSFAFNFWHAVKRGDAYGWQQDYSCKEDF